MLSNLVAELQPSLDCVNLGLFLKFFTYRGREANPPSRVGYYIGALLAQRLAKKLPLVDTAHMPAKEVHAELGLQLSQIGSDDRETRIFNCVF